jgi:hypothetical protein
LGNAVCYVNIIVLLDAVHDVYFGLNFDTSMEFIKFFKGISCQIISLVVFTFEWRLPLNVDSFGPPQI